MCSSYSHECQSRVLFAWSMISPESWGFFRLSIVGIVFACASNYRAKLVWTGVLHGCYTSPHTCNSHANSCSFRCWHGSCLCKTRANFRLAHLLHPCKTRANFSHHQSWHGCCNTSKTRANLWCRQSWHECCYMQKLCQLLDKCWTGGRGLTHGDNSSSHWHTKKVKIRNNSSCFNNCKSLISLVVTTTTTTMEK